MSKPDWTEQGWTDETVLELLWNFIETKNLGTEVDNFLQEVADEENAQSEDE